MKPFYLISILLYASIVAASDMPDRSEIGAALKSCMESVGTNSDGKPDREAVDACMSEKGYSKPEGDHPHPPMH